MKVGIPRGQLIWEIPVKTSQEPVYVDSVPYTLHDRPTEIWVDDDWAGSSPGDVVSGHTFDCDAFVTIQDGVDAVRDPGTVHVAEGTYYENVVIMDKTVELLGGYSSATWARNWQVYTTTIDGGGGLRVVYPLLADGTVIDGFEITGGDDGIWTGSDVTISNNDIWGNTGSAVWTDGACIIEDNLIHDNGSHPTGGTISLLDSAAIVRRNSIHDNNSAGVEVTVFSNPRIEDNSITGNTGHGVEGPYDQTSATITGNTIVGNAGDGISGFEDGATIDANVILDNGGWGINVGQGPITNNVVARNLSGGINVLLTAEIVNNSVADNEAGGGIVVDPLEAPHAVFNNIIWGNTPEDLTGGTATYSDIGAGYDGGGTGNISEDPLFVDPAADDYHLQSSSPCLDAGTGTGAPAEDLDGETRPMDGDGDGQADVDIGADEVSGTTTPTKTSAQVDDIWDRMLNPQPTLLTIRGSILGNGGSPVAVGSVRISVVSDVPLPIPSPTSRNLPIPIPYPVPEEYEVWTNTFDGAIRDGQLVLTLGAVRELRLVSSTIYRIVIAIDADSEVFESPDVIFGDYAPETDFIMFIP